MLRAIVALLLLLNGLYFAWWQGWLLPFGAAPVSQREPQRLAQQINPELLVVLHGEEAARSAAARPEAPPTQCLQAGLFDAEQASVLRLALQALLPAGGWSLQQQDAAGRWIIYMGKYANAAELDKKRAQLAGLNLRFEPLNQPALMPGLSLGSYTSQADANAALEALMRRGVRTARVLQPPPSSVTYQLQLEAADEAMQKQLTLVKSALAGKTLHACTAATASAVVR